MPAKFHVPRSFPLGSPSYDPKTQVWSRFGAGPLSEVVEISVGTVPTVTPPWLLGTLQLVIVHFAHVCFFFLLDILVSLRECGT